MGNARLRPCRDANSRIVRRDGVVDVNDNAGLVTSVLARDCGEWAGGAGAGASDAQLTAADVVLGAFKLFSSVESNVLSAYEIVTGRQIGGNVDGEVLNAAAAGDVSSPLETLRGDLVGGEFVDLEPVAGAVVLRGGGSRGGLGHPHGQGARVGDGGIDSEANIVTGSYGISRGLGHGGRICGFMY